jgi:hypothetical protein
MSFLPFKSRLASSESPDFGLALGGSGLSENQAGQSQKKAWPGFGLGRSSALNTHSLVVVKNSLDLERLIRLLS